MVRTAAITPVAVKHPRRLFFIIHLFQQFFGEPNAVPVWMK
jgi:hypothetical protein